MVRQAVNRMTHDEIADWCALRLRSKGYKFSLSNLTSSMHGEQPDVLGITYSGESILVEVKVSRSDFLADKKKPWRVDLNKGMGDHRVYLTPKGLLNPKEIPYGWMLWEVHGKTKPTLKIIKGHAPKIMDNPWGSGKTTLWSYLNCDQKEYLHFYRHNVDKSYRKELTWMIKVMTRAIESGFEPNKFANNYQVSS